MIVRHHLEILVDAQIGKIYFELASGGIIGEEEEYNGLAQSNIFDGFLYRTFRRTWLFDSGGDTVTVPESAGLKTNQPKINSRHRKNQTHPLPNSKRD